MNCNTLIERPFLTFSLAAPIWLYAADPDGAALFSTWCASCHNGAENSRAPSPTVLKERSPLAVLSALTAGGMRSQGARLNGLERRAVAEYLTGKKLEGDVSGASAGLCASRPNFDPSAGPSWGGRSPTTSNARFQPGSQAGLTAEQVPHLTLKWAIGFPDATSAWTQPTVAGGRLFTGSQNGTVYSLDAKSGCIYWTFSAASSVRAPLPSVRERALNPGCISPTLRPTRRRRCRHGPPDLDTENRGSSAFPHYRGGYFVREPAVCRCVVI